MRRQPVSIAADGLYRKVSVIALGLALGAALLSDGAPVAPAGAEALTQSTTLPTAPIARPRSASGLADRDAPGLQDHSAEIAALVPSMNPAEFDETSSDPARDITALPKVGYSLAATGPTQAQVRSLIEDSYRRSGNDGGGD